MTEEIKADKLKDGFEIRLTRHQGYIEVLKREKVNPRRLYPDTYYTNQIAAEKRFIVELKQLLKIYEQTIRDSCGEDRPGKKGSRSNGLRKRAKAIQKKNGGSTK